MEQFYNNIVNAGLCTEGQKVLDPGTGTGVLPRNLYRYGARFTGTDQSDRQIEQAKKLSADAGMNIAYQCAAAEENDFPANTFDVVMACQCFFYFDHARLAPLLHQLLNRLAPESFEILHYAAMVILKVKK